jgi:hypothetical protein
MCNFDSQLSGGTYTLTLIFSATNPPSYFYNVTTNLYLSSNDIVQATLYENNSGTLIARGTYTLPANSPIVISSHFVNYTIIFSSTSPFRISIDFLNYTFQAYNTLGFYAKITNTGPSPTRLYGLWLLNSTYARRINTSTWLEPGASQTFSVNLPVNSISEIRAITTTRVNIFRISVKPPTLTAAPGPGGGGAYSKFVITSYNQTIAGPVSSKRLFVATVQNAGNTSGTVKLQVRDHNNNIVNSTVETIPAGGNARISFYVTLPSTPGMYTWTAEAVNLDTGAVDDSKSIQVQVKLYRRPIVIYNTQNQNTLSNYPVLITLDTASLISAGKMRSDCGDIRFTDTDGTTQLSYWIEPNTCNTQNTKIWVKVPLIPGGSTKMIYVYYGNPSATSVSSSAAVFGKEVSSVYGRDNYYVALILANREWVDGGTNLNIYGDDSGKSINLPSSRIIYGTTVTKVYLSTNGLLRWDNQRDNRYSNYLDTASKILTVHWDDLYVSTSYRSDAGIFEISGSDVLGNYIAYRWATTYYTLPARYTPADFEILLYENGDIQFNVLRVWSGATPNEYISRGDNTNYIDLTPRWQYMESVLFIPRAVPEPTINIGAEEDT